ncbi:MAG: hypothetical protein LAQ69_32605 [Acidobacteriia bacterium]|nr:hypothetical protein [Terriglobia bacterium]
MKKWIAALAGICTAVCAQAQPSNVKLVEQNGHLSPVAIKVTYLTGQTRNLMLAGIGSKLKDSYFTHQLVVRGDGGVSQRSLWLDSIASIHGTATLRTMGDEFTVTLKDGKQVPVMFAAFHDGEQCSGEPVHDGYTCNVFYVRNEDDGQEKIELRKVKSVEFLGPVRKDKAGNAMFEHWRYSPFTGERLQ